MRGPLQRRLFAGLCLLLFWQSGCAAFRPVHGVPARYLPTEMKIGDRSDRRTIDLSLLTQSPRRDPTTGAPVHEIDAGDVLAIYVEGFVGKASDPSPVFFPVNGDTPPSFGHPYPVREDGTISLPLVGSINVRGLTLSQAEDRVLQAYLKPKELIKPDNYRVQVNLQRPRQYRVLVVRQDSRNEPQPNAFIGQLNIGMVKRGTGKVVHLPVYSNDVLNALTMSDGLPGLDAENAIYIIRRRGNSRGGTLDPRWPTDLNPALLSPQGTAPEGPVIRGQSNDDGARGYLHSESVRQVQYLQAPDAGVQPAAARLPQGYSIQNPSAPSGPTPLPTGPNSYPPIYPPSPMDGMPRLSGGAWNVPSPQYNQPPSTIDPSYSNSTMAPGMYPQPGWNPAVGTPNPSQYSNPPQSFNQPPYYSPPQADSANPADPVNANGLAPQLDPDVGLNPGYSGLDMGTLDGRHVIRIPVRLGPGETADVRPEDVLLYDGDIVFIESRDTEVFYTAGLLGGGQFTLPRDYDLDILKALSIAQSRGNMGGNRSIGGVSALNNDVTISPSTAIVLRKLPDGAEVPIKVDLYRARTDLSERIVIQPGDYILLQYTPLEAIAAFFERHLLETALFGLAAQQLNRPTTGN
ncbi:MAG: polysaccharide biosynthesis/export family protein [Planctomycetes bacterium]|nr:polysaccharide biosynthesis/export family protein [Planctomycetota bacterium]